MGWSEPEVMCKNHPDQKPQPGVCPCCLRERLCKLSGFPVMVCSSSSSTLSDSPAYYSSGASSAGTSPSHRGHYRVFSDVMMGSLPLVLNVGTELKKSRSMASVAVNRKKKEGFWSKLLRSTGKRTKRAFIHS